MLVAHLSGRELSSVPARKGTGEPVPPRVWAVSSSAKPHLSRERHECTEPVGAVCEDRLPYPRHVSSEVPIGEVVFRKVAQNKRKRLPLGLLFSVSDMQQMVRH